MKHPVLFSEIIISQRGSNETIDLSQKWQRGVAAREVYVHGPMAVQLQSEVRLIRTGVFEQFSTLCEDIDNVSLSFDPIGECVSQFAYDLLLGHYGYFN